MRLFLAIELPAAVKLSVVKFINTCRTPSGLKGKWVEANNLHITLAFLGEVTKDKILSLENELVKVAALFSEFNISIDKIIGLPYKLPRILALRAMAPIYFYDLQKNIVLRLQKIGLQADVKTPHLTLVRLKEPLRVLPITNFKALNLAVGQFVLFASTLTAKGPIYKSLKTFHLSAEPAPEQFRPTMVICVVNPNSEVLLIQHPQKPGRWQFPQGGINPGESMGSAAKRELREEVGISAVKILSLKSDIYKYTWPSSVRMGDDAEKSKYVGSMQNLAVVRVLEVKPKLHLDVVETRVAKWVPLGNLVKSLHPVRRELGKLVVSELQRLGLLPIKAGK